jgi:hypothetical protein
VDCATSGSHGQIIKQWVLEEERERLNRKVRSKKRRSALGIVFCLLSLLSYLPSSFLCLPSMNLRVVVKDQRVPVLVVDSRFPWEATGAREAQVPHGEDIAVLIDFQADSISNVKNNHPQ